MHEYFYSQDIVTGVVKFQQYRASNSRRTVLLTCSHDVMAAALAGGLLDDSTSHMLGRFSAYQKENMRFKFGPKYIVILLQ